MRIYAPVIIPAVLAGLCLLASWRPWRRRSLARHGHWGGAAAIALGYFAGHVTLASWPAFPPPKAVDWLAYLALFAGGTGILQRYWGGRWFAVWPVRLVLSGLFAGLLLRSYLQHTWSRTESMLWVCGLTVATALMWDTLERLSRKRTGASLPLSLWVLCAGSSATFVLSGSALLGQLSGSLAAVFGAAIVLTWWAPGLTLASGAMTVFVPVYAGLLIQAYFYAELPVWSAVLLYFAPFSLRFAEDRRIIYMKPWKAALVRALIIAVPVALAAALAYYLVGADAPEEYYY